jgi:hypothetical protein
MPISCPWWTSTCISNSSPSWAIGSFIPTSMSYKLNTNNQTFINKKEAYTSPNSSTKATNNQITS